MNSITYREYRLMPYFLIALILHVLYLLIWTYGTTIKHHMFELLDIPQTQESVQEQSQSEEQEQTEEERIAALKTRYSEFGAPVTFQEEPEFTQEAPFAPETQTLEDVKEQQEELETPSEQTESEETDQKLGERVDEKIGQAPQAEPEPQPTPKEVKTVQPKAPKPQQPRKPQLPPRVSSDRLAGPEMKNAAPVQKELTFADIANGFLDTIRDEGGFDFVSREGDESVRPSYEEMKYLSYHQKVAWQIQNSWRRYMNSVDDHAPDTANITFLLVIDKEGYLKDARIEHSTGHRSLDQLLLKTVQDAGPFPPLPEHFKKDIYDMHSSWVYYRETAPRGRGRFTL